MNANLQVGKSSIKLTPKVVIKVSAGLLLLVASAAILVYADVHSSSQPIYHNALDVPKMPVAIVFGAGVGTPILKDRVSTAVQLYKSGKVQKILMTGDNGQITYDEPQAMKSEAVSAGVPTEDVVCDYAGFRTYDSIYRARDIFGVKEAVLVTQAFHLPRAIFLARRLGLTVVGMDAALRDYGKSQSWFNLRELAAVETAWLDVLIHRKPKFLGKKEPLFAATSAATQQ